MHARLDLATVRLLSADIVSIINDSTNNNSSGSGAAEASKAVPQRQGLYSSAAATTRITAAGLMSAVAWKQNEVAWAPVLKWAADVGVEWPDELKLAFEEGDRKPDEVQREVIWQEVNCCRTAVVISRDTKCSTEREEMTSLDMYTNTCLVFKVYSATNFLLFFFLSSVTRRSARRQLGGSQKRCQIQHDDPQRIQRERGRPLEQQPAKGPCEESPSKDRVTCRPPCRPVC